MTLTNGLLVGREPSIMENIFSLAVTVPGLVIILCYGGVGIHFDVLNCGLCYGEVSMVDKDLFPLRLQRTSCSAAAASILIRYHT